MAAKSIRQFPIEPWTCTPKSIHNCIHCTLWRNKAQWPAENSCHSKKKNGTQAQLLAIVDTLAIFGVSWKLFPQYIKDLHIHTIGARNKQWGSQLLLALRSKQVDSPQHRVRLFYFFLGVSLCPEARPSGDCSGEQSALIVCAECLPKLCSLLWLGELSWGYWAVTRPGRVTIKKVGERKISQ